MCSWWCCLTAFLAIWPIRAPACNLFSSAYPCSLTHVFNAVDERGSKLALLAAAISYASASKQLDQLAPFLAGASTWQRDWQLTDVEARQLWLLLSDAYGKAGDSHAAQVRDERCRSSDDAGAPSCLLRRRCNTAPSTPLAPTRTRTLYLQAFLIRYLATFEAEAAAGSLSTAALEEAKGHAKDAALGYIRAPALSQRSALAHLAVVSSACVYFFRDPCYLCLCWLWTCTPCSPLLRLAVCRMRINQVSLLLSLIPTAALAWAQNGE